MSHGSLYRDLDDTRLVSRAHQARCSNGLLGIHLAFLERSTREVFQQPAFSGLGLVVGLRFGSGFLCTAGFFFCDQAGTPF